MTTPDRGFARSRRDDPGPLDGFIHDGPRHLCRIDPSMVAAVREAAGLPVAGSAP